MGSLLTMLPVPCPVLYGKACLRRAYLRRAEAQEKRSQGNLLSAHVDITTQRDKVGAAHTRVKHAPGGKVRGRQNLARKARCTSSKTVRVHVLLSQARFGFLAWSACVRVSVLSLLNASTANLQQQSRDLDAVRCSVS